LARDRSAFRAPQLGLRPPQPTSVPGCAKAPEALREAGLFHRFAQHGALDADTVHAGCRESDEHLAEVRGLLAMVVPALAIIAGPANTVASGIRDALGRPDLSGYWLHLDVDILAGGLRHRGTDIRH
jgi:arginase family enzyme